MYGYHAGNTGAAGRGGWVREDSEDEGDEVERLMAGARGRGLRDGISTGAKDVPMGARIGAARVTGLRDGADDGMKDVALGPRIGAARARGLRDGVGDRMNDESPMGPRIGERISVEAAEEEEEVPLALRIGDVLDDSAAFKDGQAPRWESIFCHNPFPHIFPSSLQSLPHFFTSSFAWSCTAMHANAFCFVLPLGSAEDTVRAAAVSPQRCRLPRPPRVLIAKLPPLHPQAWLPRW